jgi:hypothetical protein
MAAYMFKVTVDLKEVGVYKAFPEAFIEMSKKVKEQIKGGAVLQVIETTNFIERILGLVSQVLDFSEVVKLALTIGLLGENGKLQETPSLNDFQEKIIELTFITGSTETAIKRVEALEKEV